MDINKFKDIIKKSNIHHPVVVKRHGGLEYGYLRWIKDDYFIGIELFKYGKSFDYTHSINANDSVDIIIPLDIFLEHYEVDLENYFGEKDS